MAKGKELTFTALKKANKKRQGDIYKVCKNWGYLQYCLAISGEWGELCNILKKVERGSLKMSDVKQEISDELADVQIYLDNLAQSLGIDLGEATRSKFNSRSKEKGSKVKL